MSFRFVFVLSFLFFSFPVVSSAHIGGHGMNDEKVISIATEHVATLIQEKIELREIGLLDQVWTQVPASNKKIAQKNKWYYLVSFAHPKENKILYLLMSSNGDLYDVNFSGEFADMEWE